MALHASGVGRIMKQAEMRDVNGQAVTNFRLAFGNGKAKSGDYNPSTFVNAAIWGARATKLTQYLDEGKNVMVTGVITTREFTYQGEKRTSLEMKISELEFVKGDGGSGGGFGKSATGNGPPPPNDDSYGGDDSDFPF